MDADKRRRKLPIERVGVVFCAVLLSCASTRSLDLSQGAVELGRDEGILVLEVRTEVPLSAIMLSGSSIVKDLDEGDHLVVLAAAAGSLRWDRIERKVHDYWIYYMNFDLSDDRWGLTVEPGQVNYAGLLIVEEPPKIYAGGLAARGEYGCTVRMVNRSAMFIERFEREHPSIVARFPVRYAGTVRDDFLERYLETRRSLRAAEREPEKPR